MTILWIAMALLFGGVAAYSYFWPHDSAQASIYIVAALIAVVAARIEELLKTRDESSDASRRMPNEE